MEKINLDLGKLLGYRIVVGTATVLGSPKIGVKGCTVREDAAVLAQRSLLAAKIGIKTGIKTAVVPGAGD